MPAKLYCKTGELAGASYTIEREATIGRASENTIVLHPSIVSSQHAHIVFDDKEQCYFIHDLGSRNGTSVDGVEVTGPIRLGMLHVITFADELNFFFQHVPAASRKPASPRPAPAKPSGGAPASRPSPATPQAPAPPQESAAASSEESGAHTVFGLAFDALPSFDENPSGIREAAKGAKPGSASGSADESELATQYGFTMGQLPSELAEPTEEDDAADPPERVTQRAPEIGQLPELEEPQAAPSTPSQPPPTEEEDDAPRTHFWGDFDALPNLDSGAFSTPKQPPAARPKGRTPTEPVPSADDTQQTEPEFGAFYPPLPRNLPEPPVTSPGVGDEHEIDLEANTVFSWGAFAFEIHKGDIEQRWFDLKPGETTVGRRRDNDIPIPHHSISRLHALFVVRGNTVSIMDCGSKNHTLVNGKRIDPQVEHQLEPGNTVRFGPQFEGTLHYK